MCAHPDNQQTTAVRLPTLRESLPVWLKIGLLSFGGPAGQIALMHHELVERRRWITNARFLHALNYCMLLPGPEAQQLSIYLGWLIHRTPGGIIAGTLFVLPGALLMLGISLSYVYLGNLPWMSAIFYGLKASVLALVAAALIRIGTKVLKAPLLWLIAAASFIAIFFFTVPLPLIILSAMLIGIIGNRFLKSSVMPEEEDAVPRPAAPPSMIRMLRTSGIWLLIWMFPLACVYLAIDPDNVLFREAVFFSKAALITFGGAYSVLPYVAQQAVEVHGWLTTAQMMDGLALAETTPGPLILVLQFVGFLGGWNQAGTWSPAAMAVAASVMATWMTFVPGFLFIFAGAPFVEYTHGLKRLGSVMTAITAAVLGVILNLAIWFGLHVLFPAEGRIDWLPCALAALFLLALQRKKMDALHVVAAGALAGLIMHLAGWQ